MKKLEDIKKENIYKVPERYFDELPMRIQNRISGKSESAPSMVFNWTMAVKIAVPAFVLAIAVSFGILFQSNNTTQDAETLLAQVSTEDMIAYLQETDISVDEILNEIQFDEIADELVDEHLLLDDEELTGDLYDELILEYGNNEI